MYIYIYIYRFTSLAQLVYTETSHETVSILRPKTQSTKQMQCREITQRMCFAEPLPPVVCTAVLVLWSAINAVTAVV